MQTGTESTWAFNGSDDIYLLTDNTGTPGNRGVRDVLDFVNPGDEIYMQTGCGYASGLCTYAFVQDQAPGHSPNYWGGFVTGPTPSGTSAECSVENPIPDWILPWFGTASFQLCRVSTSEFGTDYGESGIGNVIPNGHYTVLTETDRNTFYNCYTVNNFTDANNWTFYVDRDTSVNTQDC